jgi:hypothetical protein
MGAYVDAEMVVHYDVTDGSGNHWHGNAQVLVFAWKNNMGTVTTQALGGGNWMQIPLSNGTIFGAGCALNMVNGSTLQLPAAAGNGSTLQINIGSHNGLPESGTDHCQGVGACYLDAEDQVHVFFQNGSGTQWPGTADIFAIYCVPSAAPSTQVQVTPATASIQIGNTQGFSAAVLNNANPNVKWSVDGIAGGNVTVGTISASGLYNPPDSIGAHTITATSIASPSCSGSATVTIWGTETPNSSDYLTTGGNIIDVNDNPIIVEEG